MHTMLIADIITPGQAWISTNTKYYTKT